MKGIGVGLEVEGLGSLGVGDYELRIMSGGL